MEENKFINNKADYTSDDVAYYPVDLVSNPQTPNIGLDDIKSGIISLVFEDESNTPLQKELLETVISWNVTDTQFNKQIAYYFVYPSGQTWLFSESIVDQYGTVQRHINSAMGHYSVPKDQP